MGLGDLTFILFAYVILAALIGIAVWLFISIPIYLFLTKVGYDKCFLAFIPFCKWFAVAQVCEMDGSGEIIVFNSRMSRNVCGIIACVSPVLCIIPGLGSLVMLVINTIFLGSIFRDFFAKYDNVNISRTKILGAFAGAGSIIGVAKIYQYLSDIKHGVRFPMYVPAHYNYMRQDPYNQQQFNNDFRQDQNFRQDNDPIDLHKE